jgi:ABC-type bacteriocin/lantibiotic exporter with double-glycine peptidase domain
MQVWRFVGFGFVYRELKEDLYMKYEVPLVPQMTNMSCWAASIAMILGWKRRMSIPDDVIARNPGGSNYMTSYATGLDPNDQYILRANGFEIDAPKCYTVSAINSLLIQKGPLWVATWAPGPHIRVVTGMSGSALFINDPGPVGSGSQYIRTFTQFFGAMENLGSRELQERSPVYVAYLS